MSPPKDDPKEPDADGLEALASGFVLATALAASIDEEAFLLLARRCWRKVNGKPLNDA